MKHNTSEENLAHALELALELQKKGVPAREILGRFPQFRDELEPLLSLISAVGEEKKGIVPDRALLSRILTRLEGGVTGARVGRLKKGGYGRTSFISLIKNAMSPFRFIVPVGAVILLLLIVGIRQFGSHEPEQLSLKVDELENEARGLEAIRGESGILTESAGEQGAMGKSNIAPVPAPAALGAPSEPQSPVIEKAAVASEREDLESDFSEFDEFNQNDAEIDQAFSEF